MEIRMAKIGDIPGMLELLRQVGDVHHEIRPDIFRTGALKYDENALKTILADETKPIFVAADNGFVAGYCFCVLKDHRGSGIATALYRHATEYAKTLGCAFVSLHVWCGNDGAMAFYEKMGLRPRHIMLEMPLEEENAD